jgi:hypothetical protein
MTQPGSILDAESGPGVTPDIPLPLDFDYKKAIINGAIRCA